MQCLYDCKYRCVSYIYFALSRYGQCGLLEAEVESVCGAWSQCAGAVCRPSYDGYCLARGEMTDAIAASDAWGYRKAPRK